MPRRFHASQRMLQPARDQRASLPCAPGGEGTAVPVRRGRSFRLARRAARWGLAA